MTEEKFKLATDLRKLIYDDQYLLKEMQKLFAKTAEVNTEEGMAAYKEFAAAITTPILQKIELESIMRQLFSVERLGRIRTSLKPNFRSSSIRMCGFLGLEANMLKAQLQ